MPSIYTLSNSLEEAHSAVEKIIAAINGEKKFICEKIKDIKMFLYEIITNAIEHGNLEIDADTKSEMLEAFDNSLNYQIP